MVLSAQKPYSVPLRIGGSCTVRASHAPNSENNMSPTLSTFDDFVVSARVTLYNTVCWHYHNHPDGCKKGDTCPFLHDETPLCQPIFYNGTEQPRTRDVCNTKPIEAGPLVDAVIYMKNLPPVGSDTRRVLQDIANNRGTVVKLNLLQSKLSNGRRSGFLHMTSELHAKAVVLDICATKIDGEWLFAKYERTDPPSQQTVLTKAKANPPLAIASKPTQARQSPIMDEQGFVTVRPIRAKQRVLEDPPKTINKSASFWSLLGGGANDDYDSVNDDNDEASNAKVSLQSGDTPTEALVTPLQSRIKPIPALESNDSPDSVTGFNPWCQSVRSSRIRNELAHLRIAEHHTPGNAFKAFKLDASPTNTTKTMHKAMTDDGKLS